KPPADPREHVRLMADLQALALQTDSTSVITFMVANEGSNRSYPHLGVDEGHHSLSHHGGDAAKREQLRRINLEHVEHLAHLLAALRAVEERDGTLLDASIVVYGSGIADGNAHDHHDLPILVCGGGNGTLGAGRHVRYPAETPLNDLHVALLGKVGAPAVPFGDARGALDGI
ncbi:MAG TPA: DUF1552 domain-containing protein, partial [Planctomycetota bacterium]|nr:DUF1552 domain-containing protein [Planctomycetota bacterium]